MPPFLGRFSHGLWRNTKTGERVEVSVVGWRPPRALGRRGRPRREVEEGRGVRMPTDLPQRPFPAAGARWKLFALVIAGILLSCP